jgi:hypothetical protein
MAEIVIWIGDFGAKSAGRLESFNAIHEVISSVSTRPDLEDKEGSSTSGAPCGAPQFGHVDFGRKTGFVGRETDEEGLKTSSEPRVFFDDCLFCA